MRQLKIAAVSYLNTKPFLFGLENSEAKEKFKLTMNYPAAIAQQLKNGDADIALIPVAEIKNISNAKIISDYCIGCDGAVGSVCLYSEVEIENVKEIFLDYQSRTSVELLKILLKHHWKINPTLLPSYPGYEDDFNGATAGLVIGDRTFELKNQFEFVYDLGEEWKKLSGLPFVFAAWVSRVEFSSDIINLLNTAFKSGIDNIESVSEKFQSQYPTVDVKKYLTEQISFSLDEKKKEGMKRFLAMIR